MEIQLMTTFSYSKSHRRTKIINSSWQWRRQVGITTICFKAINYCGVACYEPLQEISASRKSNFCLTKAYKKIKQPGEKSIEHTQKKGTVVGAIALIIGTSIGSGILALPNKTSPAGFVPSGICLIFCWGFLLIEAILLAEINVGLLRKRKQRREEKEEQEEEEEEVDVISIRTMAQETLGELGGTLATVTYIFLGYTTMVAYTSKSGEILNHLINLPTSISGFFFTIFFTILIFAGGTRATDQVNQWLTATMIGLLLAIEVLAVLSNGWSGLEATGDWGKVPGAIPVIIFSLVYHDLAPVICAYLGGDIARIRTSITLGSLVPLIALLVWDAIALGLSTQGDQVVDPVDLLMMVKWSGVSVMVEAFSLLAVGTSIIGTLLGFSQFFLEQLNNLSRQYSSANRQKLEENSRPSVMREETMLLNLSKWWGSNKFNFTAAAMAVTPPLFVSTNIPDAFFAATDIAGGYCMMVLYGILPPAMAWAMHTRSSDDGRGTDNGNGDEDEDNSQKVLSSSRSTLIGVGLIACGIIMEQIIQDLLVLSP